MRDDVEAGLKQLKPSTKEWFVTVRYVATFAHQDGVRDELAAFLRANEL